jgi:sterol desaturase/sphingolipid hydroxylase (fatty acid hydroxylase superfamily)
MLAVPVAAIFAPFYAEQHQFGHANIALPAWLDRTLRLLIVTPDMHRVHHSVRFREHDSNYGFNLSIWDRTYTAQARGWPRGHDHRPFAASDRSAHPFRSVAPSALCPKRADAEYFRTPAIVTMPPPRRQHSALFEG